MKKILIPIDFSEHSEYALEVAAKIAKKERSFAHRPPYDGTFYRSVNKRRISRNV